MKKADTKFLENLPEKEFKRLKWYLKHPPKLRAKNHIPQDKKSLDLWDSLPFQKGKKKIFPIYKDYVWTCKKFGVIPEPKFKKGIPESILSAVSFNCFKPSIIKVYNTLYNISHYIESWKGRYSEHSIGLLVKLTGYSHATVERSLKFLRNRWYIRPVWRGRPTPENIRYHHSCDELPLNMDHIISWRTNKGRKRKKRKN